MNTDTTSRSSTRRPPAQVPRWRRARERLSLSISRHGRGRVHGILLGLCVALFVFATVDRARTAEHQWGRRAIVAVASADLVVGDEITDAGARLRPVPLSLLPSRPLTEIPVGAVVSAPISAGQILTELIVVGDREGLVPGQRAVTIPVPLAVPDLRVGDRVEVHAVRADGHGGAAVDVLVSSAVIANLPEGGVTLAVPAATVPRVWHALATGSVELARRPPEG